MWSMWGHNFVSWLSNIHYTALFTQSLQTLATINYWSFQTYYSCCSKPYECFELVCFTAYEFRFSFNIVLVLPSKEGQTWRNRLYAGVTFLTRAKLRASVNPAAARSCLNSSVSLFSGNCEHTEQIHKRHHYLMRYSIWLNTHLKYAKENQWTWLAMV